MLFNGLLKKSSDLFDRVRSRHAARNIWRVGSEVRSGVFDDDRVLRHRDLRSKPACLTMLASVPFGISLPIPPETQTAPDLAGCVKWPWLPAWRIWTQPARSNSRITSRTCTDPERSGAHVSSSVFQRKSVHIGIFLYGRNRIVPNRSALGLGSNSHREPFTFRPAATRCRLRVDFPDGCGQDAMRIVAVPTTSRGSGIGSPDSANNSR